MRCKCFAYNLNRITLWNFYSMEFTLLLTLQIVVCLNSGNKIWILRMTDLFHADMVTYLCCLTNRTSEPEPGKHAVLGALMQCRVPGCNERDILMAFHLFMRRKWRGTVTFWNGWQNKEPNIGEMIVFMISVWHMRVSRERLTDTFLTVQSVKWCDVWQHARAWGHTLLYIFTLRISVSRVKTQEQLKWQLFQLICQILYKVQ